MNAYDTKLAMQLFHLVTLFAACSFSLSWCTIPPFWTEIRETTTAYSRRYPAFTYCPDFDAAIIFGGESGEGQHNDLFSYDFGTTLTSMVQPVIAPNKRSLHEMVLLKSDENNCRLLLFGGFIKVSKNDAPIVYGDTWILDVPLLALNGTEQVLWTSLPGLANSGPSKRFGFGLTNRGENEAYLFGGASLDDNGYAAAVFDDVWKFDLQIPYSNSAWILQPPEGRQPEKRFAMSTGTFFGTTSDDDRMIVFGGRSIVGDDASDNFVLDDYWHYNFETRAWVSGKGYGVPRAYHSTAIYGGKTIVFGGYYEVTSSSVSAKTINDVLVTDIDVQQCTSSTDEGSLWCYLDVPVSPLVALAVEPIKRYGHASLVRGNKLVIFGGLAPDSYLTEELRSDVWELNLDSAILQEHHFNVDSTYLDLGLPLSATMYFLYAVLSMMVLSFVVFVVSLKQGNDTYVGRAMFTQNGNFNNASQGVPTEIIESLPKRQWNKGDDENQVEDHHDLCPICLNDYEEEESLTELPCGHFYHHHCVAEWLENRNACPMCKRPVIGGDESATEEDNQVEDDLRGSDLVPTTVVAEEISPLSDSYPVAREAGGGAIPVVAGDEMS